MNPRLLLLLIAITALLGSCTKDNPTPENSNSFIVDDKTSDSAIEFFYPENSDSDRPPNRIVSFVPFSTI